VMFQPDGVANSIEQFPLAQRRNWREDSLTCSFLKCFPLPVQEIDAQCAPYFTPFVLTILVRPMSDQAHPKFDPEQLKPSTKSFYRFAEEFAAESDRAAVILGAAKLDVWLLQILQARLLPCSSGRDELLEGDFPLGTFSARINMCYRLGI